MIRSILSKTCTLQKNWQQTEHEFDQKFVISSWIIMVDQSRKHVLDPSCFQLLLESVKLPGVSFTGCTLADFLSKCFVLMLILDIVKLEYGIDGWCCFHCCFVLNVHIIVIYSFFDASTMAFPLSVSRYMCGASWRVWLGNLYVTFCNRLVQIVFSKIHVVIHSCLHKHFQHVHFSIQNGNNFFLLGHLLPHLLGHPLSFAYCQRLVKTKGRSSGWMSRFSV